MELPKKLTVRYRYTYYLLAAYLFCILATMATANYEVKIWQLVLPGGIFIFPLTFMVNDITAETYGYVYPRLFIWLGIFISALFAGYTSIISLAAHPSYFLNQPAYETVFLPTIRFFFASVVGIFVGEFVNIYLLAKWKILYTKHSFIMRALGSTAIGQLALSCSVDVVAFAGTTHGFEHLLNMMLSGFLIKMLGAMLGVVPSWLIVKYLKSKDKADHYDLSTNFNPFRLKLD